ncbi:subtilase family domain-containing protein [Penicillium riverlandense]|uniref:subtilase family domain-containing protein n=1 Tax=Penicillium riverlandense TaxID=1903569 RepID=UPI0025496962|nr:subtilase family domain-containing protein [Penicillium riverlandense]KAJ5811811.1 subtilase family domain-containing protein [Penicillium riverlandense]
MEGAFAPDHRARTLSRPLLRRLSLLRAVLPSLESAAGNMYYAPKRKRFSQDKVKQFWAKFLVPCLRMSPNGWKFHNFNDQHHELVSRLLERLEKTVFMEKSALAEEFKSSTFPQLETLRSWTRDTPGDTEDIENLFAGRWSILVPSDQLARKDLITLLDKFADAMEGPSKPPPSGEAMPVVSTMFSLTASRLHRNIEGQSLFKLPETDPGGTVEQSELDIDSKTCLAVVLSHSLLDFCWEPWFLNGWSKSSIKLLQNCESLSLRPTLATSLRPRSRDPSLPTMRNDLKLLFHGILLMEIFKQAEIPLAMNHQDMIIDIESFRVTARKEFGQINWAIYEGFRHGPFPFKFFDTDDRPDETQTKRAKEWFQRYDQALHAQQEALPIKGKGITVAVLDTGINLQNSWISARIGRTKCWPSRDSCNDTDGHGTHVAYLLMRLAPSANIRIAKISDSQLINNDAIIQRIAKAIEHFSSENGDPVDIINLSFGFPEYNDRLQPIRKALLQAQQNNVLLFAAAGNSAGNEGVYWPASMEVVTRVNAVDGDGNVANISTTGGELRPIFTLGEGVPSCQLGSPGNEIIYRSGTSFATPIAVAIAAIVLGYIDGSNKAAVPEDVESLKSRLRTKSGMEGVLRETCVLQEPMKRTDIAYIAPFFFLTIEASSLVGIITNALRTCAG